MKQAFVFDIDDTLSNTSHRHQLMTEGRWNEYFALCGEDDAIQGVCAVATALHRSGYVILFVTGRSESVREYTLKWLAKYVCPGLLFMRQEGDFRSSSMIKLEILGELRKEYDILMVFDDQPAACKMWREQGLRCAQVAAGDAYMEYTRT